MNGWPRIFTRTGRALAYAALVLTLVGIVGLATAGYWLVPQPEEPRHADFVVVLAGGFERSFYAADLLRQGVATKVWVSRPARERVAAQLESVGIVLPHEEDIHRAILVHCGVRADAIEFVGDGSMSTAEEARNLRRRVAQASLRLIVVTSPAHVRRARMILADTFRGMGTVIQVVATPYESFDPQWWRDQGSARAVVLEIAKFAHYLGGGRFVSTAE